METITDKIKRFLQVYDGYGCGSGCGLGSGLYCSNGYGRGSGNGNGDGWGYGRGSGSGNGKELGSGSGSGCGNGNGYVWGYINARFKSYNGHKLYFIDGITTIIYSVHDNIAQGAIVSNDLTLTRCYLAKVDDCIAHGDTPHSAYRDAMAKALNRKPIEDRITEFINKYPDFKKKIPATELFVWHNILTGSCEFGRKEFARAHNINLETDKFSPQEFIAKTKNSYGGENIKLLAKKYKDK